MKKESDKQKMYKKGYCSIEKIETIFKKIDNGKFVCISSNCSHVRGQYTKPPKSPKIKKNYL